MDETEKMDMLNEVYVRTTWPLLINWFLLIVNIAPLAVPIYFVYLERISTMNSGAEQNLKDMVKMIKKYN